VRHINRSKRELKEQLRTFPRHSSCTHFTCYARRMWTKKDSRVCIGLWRQIWKKRFIRTVWSV